MHREAGATSGVMVVSSNCQTAGLAASLRMLLPRHAFSPVPLPDPSDSSGTSELVEALRGASAWASLGRHELLNERGLEHVRLVRIPAVLFRGFHPDLVYAKRASDGALVEPHYNSAIAVCAYNHGLSPADAARLYDRATLRALGYFEAWVPAAEALEEMFAVTDVDFGSFFLAARREGVFLHSINHPKPIAFACLARAVASRFGASRIELEADALPPDGLEWPTWPVYPDIADELGVCGSWDWRISENHWISGIEKYLEFAYEGYVRQGIAPGELRMARADASLYERVLFPGGEKSDV